MMRKTTCFQMLRDDLLAIEQMIQKAQCIAAVAGMSQEMHKFLCEAIDLRIQDRHAKNATQKQTIGSAASMTEQATACRNSLTDFAVVSARNASTAT
jgi:hypothetical protein